VTPSIRQLIQQIGWCDFLIRATSRALAALSLGKVKLHRDYIVAQPLAAVGSGPVRRTGSFVIRSLGSSCDPLVARLPRPQEEIRERFASGAECFVAERDGEPVAFLWVHRASFLDAEVRSRFLVEPYGKAVWDFDVYVDPRFRGSTIFWRLWQEASRILLSRGVEWSISRISAENDGSISAHRRMGAYPVATAIHLCIGRIKVTLSDMSPHVHFSFSESRHPCYRVNAQEARRRRYFRFASAA
jgi:Acetyltransferase (GNAT) family.